MMLTRNFKETVNAHAQREPEFASVLLDKAVSLFFLKGETETARLLLKSLVNMRFKPLDLDRSKPSESLFRSKEQTSKNRTNH
jgi:hypothetical protein